MGDYFNQDSRQFHISIKDRNESLKSAPADTVFCCLDCRRACSLLSMLQMNRVKVHLVFCRHQLRIVDMSVHEGLCPRCERARLKLPESLHAKDPHSLPTRARCHCCRLTLESSSFRLALHRSTGHCTYCKVCDSEKKRKSYLKRKGRTLE